MYLNYYGFKREPFQVTPDPDFLFFSPSHKEALGAIIYGIENRRGFIEIVGEVGVGKTTILRSYLQRADRKRLKVLYLFNANISFEDLLRAIFREMGIERRADAATSDMINELHKVLIEEYKQGHNVVLAIDEAQNMPVDTLENLRMLSNLETSTEKLIQILLIGQPELDRKLDLNELRQFKQRIAVRSRIQPLTPKESMDYILHRLTRVSTSRGEVFTSRALKLIVEHAGGIPRVINTLCSNALVTGFGYQQKPITHTTVKEVIADLQQKKMRPMIGFRAALAVLALIAAVFLGISLYGGKVTSKVKAFRMPQIATSQTTTNLHREAPTPGERAPASGETAAPGEAEPAAVENPPSPSQTAQVNEDNNEEMSRDPRTARKDVAPVPQPPSSSLPAGEEPPMIQVPTGMHPEPDAGTSATEAIAGRGLHESAQDGDSSPSGSVSAGETDSGVVTKIVKKGDTLNKLMMEVYGFNDRRLIESIRQANPHIQDVNKIWAGDTVRFPPAGPNM